MKIRNGFVSNSSSSSFIIIGDSSKIPEDVNYMELTPKHAEIAVNALKNGYSWRGNLKMKWEPDTPVYLTEFVSDALDTYREVREISNAYPFEDGGHGVPYDEDYYIRLDKASNSSWELFDGSYGGIFFPRNLLD